MGRNQYWAGRVYDLCVYYMTGTPEGSTESGFMEKPGFEPATHGKWHSAYPLHHGGFSIWARKYHSSTRIYEFLRMQGK